jgi:hypothetical protein
MRDRVTPSHSHAAEASRLASSRRGAGEAVRRSAFGELEPNQIKTVLDVHLAGRPVPPAVLEHTLREVCRLIDEGLVASSPSGRS